MITWIVSNRKWLFSGIGVFLIAVVFRVDIGKSPQTTESTDGRDLKSQETTLPFSTEDNDTGAIVGEFQVPVDAYVDLFDGYLRYFVASLTPNGVEQVVGDDLLRTIIRGAVHVTDYGEVYFSVTPWNYAALLRDQLEFFRFREAVPAPKGNWGTYHDEENPIDRLYYPIKTQIRSNLRSYFANPDRLDSFYHLKKDLILSELESQVPLAL